MSKNPEPLVIARRWLLGMVLVAAIAALLWRGGPLPVQAFEDDLDIECSENPVSEGGAFRLNVTSGQANNNNPDQIAVYWATIPGTADGSDYTPFYLEYQTSTETQTSAGSMGRTFQTAEDQHSEFTETYTVRAINASLSGAGAGDCNIEIEDDDGPGAALTWIDSVPAAQGSASSDQTADGSVYGGYRLGDTIKVKQQFTEIVTVGGGKVTVALHIGTEDNYQTRNAEYKRGGGTDTLEFEYKVVESDLDPDGIVIPRSSYGGGGSIVTKEDGSSVNTIYEGSEEGMGQTVYGGPYIQELNVSSEPAEGDTYKFGETIEITAKFNHEVTVDGDAAVRVLLGNNDEEWVDAEYSKGSGTKTLVFKHDVASTDIDSDGISIEPGYRDAEDNLHGIAANGSVTRESKGYAIHPFYDGLDDQSGHKIDGSPYVIGMSVTSTPSSGDTYGIGEEIEITVYFDQNLSLTPSLSVPLTIGDGFNAETYTASYSSDSQDHKAVFIHTVYDHQRDDDGISVSAGRRIIGNGTIYAAGTAVEAHREIPELPDQSGHQVYAFLPSVSSNAITSTPAAGNTYLVGETLEFSLTFYYAVQVDGTPTIRILLGADGGQRNAAYSSGAGTDTLKFSYVVQAADVDTNGVGILQRPSGGFEGGHVKQPGTTNYSRGYIPGLDNQEGHQVDGRPYVTASTVTSSPASGVIYGPGEDVVVSLTFDRAVDVAESPSIKLTLGDDEKDAVYSSGSGSDTLAFKYVVQANDEDTDGLALEGQESEGFGGSGGIYAHGTRAAAKEVIPGLGSQAGHLVDAVPPQISGAETSSDGTTVTLTFSEHVNVSPELRTLSTFAGVDVGVYLRVLFDVFVDGHRMHTTGATVSGDKLTLTLDTPITTGRSVTAEYDNFFAGDLPGLLIDDLGNALEGFNSVAVTNNSSVADDDDTLWPVLSSHDIRLTADGTASYTLALASEPDEDVMVSLTISPSDRLTANHASLTFTPENWETPQTVTLTAQTGESGHNSWHEIIHYSAVHGFVVGHTKVLIEGNE